MTAMSTRIPNPFERAVAKWRQGQLSTALVTYASRKARQALRRVRVANFHYWLDADRVYTKRFGERFGQLSGHHQVYGNYWLDSRLPLGPQSVVYSLGVGGDIQFDLAVAEKVQCEVHLYDPTPSSIEFMEQQAQIDDAPHKLLRFHPQGAWDSNTTLRFNVPKRGGSASAVSNESSASFFEAPCVTVAEMMKQNGHREIDVLKMDIEGAAERIVADLLKNGIFPKQLVVEFERPTGSVDVQVAWFQKIEGLSESLKSHGYEATLLPRDRARYFGLEILFARVS